MTVEDIFRKLSAHMIKGVMLHEQMANYYDFLNLHGYKRCHEYRTLEEMCGLRKLHRYYVNHYDRLIPEDKVDDPEAIPASWYKYARQDVDITTKKNAVRLGIDKWVEWEIETKDLYQKMYKELMDLGEVASANKIACWVVDVDKELKHANRKAITLKSVDYNLDYVCMEQDELHDKYKKKIKNLGECL